MAIRLTSALRLLGTIVTILLLASISQDSTRPLLGSHEGGLSTFAIEASGRVGEESTDGVEELVMEGLIVDGRLLRWESVERSGTWQTEHTRGTGVPAVLTFREVSRPGVVRFKGTSFVAVFKADRWPGVLRVEQNGKETQLIDVTGARREEPIIIEYPVVQPSVSVFVMALVLFTGLAYSFGPIRSEHGTVSWVIVVLIGTHLLFWGNQCVATTNDSPGYLKDFHFFMRGESSYFPPGYPLLLGMVESISADRLGGWITLIQHGMAVLAGIWISSLLQRITHPQLAMIGGLLAGLLPSSLIIPQSVMSETPTLFAMVGACYLTVRSTETERTWLAALAGALAGGAVITRIVPLAGLVPAFCLIYFGTTSTKRVRLLCVTIAAMTGVVLLTILWTWPAAGRPMLSDSTGLHLFNRVVAEQKQLDEEAPATRQLLTLLEGHDPRGMAHWETKQYAGIRQLDSAEREALLRNVALEGIGKTPQSYLLYSFALAWRMLVDDPFGWISTWGGTNISIPSLETPPPLGFSRASLILRRTLEDTHRVLWPILCWTAVAGTFLGLLLPQRALILALAWIPTGYLLASASVEYFNPRFNVAIAPFIVALAMVPLGILFHRLSYQEVQEQAPKPGPLMADMPAAHERS